MRPATRRSLSLVTLLAAHATGSCLDAWTPPVTTCTGPRCPDAGARTDAPGDAPSDVAEDRSPARCEGMSLLDLSSSQNESSCAVRCDGTVWCWGNNEWGQLGDGTLESRSSPVRVLGLGGPATAVSVGHSATCAVAGGAAWCWGENTDGQLGDGTRTERSTPSRVVGIEGAVVAVAAGGTHACALVADGSLWCWGGNRNGALGDGTVVPRLRPVAVPSLRGAVAEVVAGQYHTCARLRDGDVRCWGMNMFGGLGDGSILDRATPVRTSLPAAAVALASTSNHACAVLDDGTVWCWGYNSDGAVSRSLSNHPTPIAVPLGGRRALAVTTGQRHTCAIVEGAGLLCWGRNDTGQVGDGSTMRRLAPVAATALDGDVRRVSAGVEFSCAALVDGRARCVGGGSRGQLGNNAFEGSLTPVTVALPP
ncbi:MAG: hypothetical protein U0326_18400 [Polyangiales bacterium]